MTDNEAKRFLKIEKECINRNCDRNCAQCDIVQKVEDLNSAYDAAIKALEDVLQYRALEKRLSDMFCSSVSLKSVVDELERNLKEPDSPHPMKARILTYKESADWDAYRAIGTPEECRSAMEKQNVNKELESHDETRTLECCISLMHELVNEFAEWYRWQHGEDAIEKLDKEERFCFRKSYFRIVQELFLLGTNHSGGTSTRAKCEQLGVDSSEEIEFDWSGEE